MFDRVVKQMKYCFIIFYSKNSFLISTKLYLTSANIVQQDGQTDFICHLTFVLRMFDELLYQFDQTLTETMLSYPSLQIIAR